MWETLKAFLTAKTTLDVSIILILLCGVLWSLAGSIVYIVRKTHIIKIGGVEIGKEGQLSPHTKCVHNGDIVKVLAAQSEMLNNVNYTKQMIMPNQMRYADAVITESKGLMQKTFLNLLGQEEPEQGVSSVDYNLYRLCLRTLQEDLKEYYKACFRENHLAEKSSVEFKVYIDHATADIVQKATDSLNSLYKGQIVSRVALYEANKIIIPAIKDQIEDVFRNGRDVAIKAEVDIQVLQEKFNQYLYITIG
jgi:hypothetical protein